ncbi:MAG: PilZ domain-containing protein [Planctomycetota bacterium]
MGHDWSDNILIVKLPTEPRTSDELNAVTRLVLDRPKSDLLLDIGAVEKPTYQTLCKLTELRCLLSDCGCYCAFYNVNETTKRVFNRYGFDSFFEIAGTSEIVVEPSVEQMSTGTLELHSSDKSEPFERRKYVRLHVPTSLEINVLLWHSGRKDDYHKTLPGHYWKGRLVDISEGGAQVAIDAVDVEETILCKGRLLGMEFKPNPTEPLLAFDAQIREILPTADGMNTCLGLQLVGLETNPDGREGLKKLCSSEGIYYEAKETSWVFRLNPR